MPKISSLWVLTLCGVAILFAGSTIVGAEDNCQKRVINADHKLHEAIEHHGPGSSQAQHWRNELAQARAYCWDHSHRWWDEDQHRWRTGHDWNDHDHDHH
jgi:hypothetical protein